MRCPWKGCGFDHTETSGRLLQLAPTFGLRRSDVAPGIASAIFRPHYYVGKQRVDAIENGRLVTCLACGNNFGVDHDGVFLIPGAPQAAPQPPVNGARTHAARAAEEPPPRPAHLLDDDMAQVPQMD